MKIKRLIGLPLAMVLGLGFVFTLALNGVADAAAPYTCTWTGSGGNDNFSTAGNWSGCNSAAPQPADNDTLVFNSITTSTAFNNDITGLNLTNITISGTETGQLTITGNTINLSGGITDTATGSSSLNNTINTPIDLTGNQTFNASSSGDYLGFGGAISLSTYNLTVNASPGNGNNITFNDPFSGSGNLTFSGAGDYQYMPVSSPNYTGATTIDSGAGVEIADNNFTALGSGPITVNSGGSLVITSTDDTVNFPNALNIAGSGDENDDGTFAALTSCIGFQSPGNGGGFGFDGNGCTNAASTLNLTGAVTLSADTTFVNGYYQQTGSTSTAVATIALIGSYTPAGFTLTSPSDSNTVIVTPGEDSSSGVSAPSTPDTGLALTHASVIEPILAGLAVSIGLLFLSRKLSNSTITKRR